MSIALIADDYTDAEFCIGQLVHFWNVPIFKSGKEIFKERMRNCNWSDKDIEEMDLKALKKSNWSKPSFVEMMIRNPRLFEDKPKKEGK